MFLLLSSHSQLSFLFFFHFFRLCTRKIGTPASGSHTDCRYHCDHCLCVCVFIMIEDSAKDSSGSGADSPSAPELMQWTGTCHIHLLFLSQIQTYRCLGTDFATPFNYRGCTTQSSASSHTRCPFSE
jgi:hypothetical protein